MDKINPEIDESKVILKIIASEIVRLLYSKKKIIILRIKRRN